MTRLPLVLFVALAACQMLPKQPERIQSQPLTEAKVPVAVSCIDVASIAPLPTTSMPPRAAPPDALAAGAAADLIVWRERARLLREQLLACAQAPKQGGTP